MAAAAAEAADDGLFSAGGFSPASAAPVDTRAVDTPDQNPEIDEGFYHKDSDLFYQRYTDFRILSNYNFKGGVGKTTSTYATAEGLAARYRAEPPTPGHPSKRMRNHDKPAGVLMVDFDPQMSLTSYVLGRTFYEVGGYDQFFEHESYKGRYNSFLALAGPIKWTAAGPHQEVRPAQVTRIMLSQHVSDSNVAPMGDHSATHDMARPSPKRAKEHGHKGKAPPEDGEAPDTNLFLLPGSFSLSDIDTELTRLWKLADNANVFRLAALYHMLWMTAAYYNIKTVIIDLPPAATGLSQTAILSSHYFTIPFFADFFSEAAIDAFATLVSAEDEEEEEGDFAEPPLDQHQMPYAAFVHRFIVEKGVWPTSLAALLKNCDRGPRALRDARGLADHPSTTGIFPDMRKLLGWSKPGPKFLGGILTRMAYSARSGTGGLFKSHTTAAQGLERRIFASKNNREFFRRVQESLAQLHGNIHEWFRCDDAGVLAESPGWADDLAPTDFILGVMEEGNQLRDIAQREGLPIHALAHPHLYTYNDQGSCIQLKKDKVRIILDYTIPRHVRDIDILITRLTEMMAFAETMRND
jgi:cellulose biosynthesis protein BcsQ